MVSSPLAPHHIRVATTSAATAATTGETLDRLDNLATQAAREEADLLLLPEAFLGGYPRGEVFGCEVGSRSDEGREEFRKYFEGCVDFGDVVGLRGEGGGTAWVRRELPEVEEEEEEDDDDDDLGGLETEPPQKKEKRLFRGDGTRERLEEIASRTGVFLVVGCVERCGGSLYCAVVYVCPRRGCVGKRRKTQPTGSERLIWAQAGAGTLKAVSAVFGGGGGGGTTTTTGKPREKIRVNMAAAICWESYMPMLRQTLYAQNVNLYLAPTADGRDTWMSLLRTVALEGRCAVVSANMCVSKEKGWKEKGMMDGKKKEKKKKKVDDDDDDHGTTTKPIPGEAAPPYVTMSSGRRRSSIIDEDGNEIVLPGIGKDAGAEDEEVVVEEEEEKKEDEVKKEFLSRGGSSIVSPMGQVLAGPQWETEYGDDGDMLYADVDMRDCIRGRLDLDAAGSYSRNDAFYLQVEGLELDPLPYY